MKLLNSSERVELAIRAGTLAKASLQLTDAKSNDLARLMFVDIVRAVKEIDDFLKKVSA